MELLRRWGPWNRTTCGASRDAKGPCLMDALLILVVLLGWFALALWLAWRIARWRLRPGVTLARGVQALLAFPVVLFVFWAIPFGDQALARNHFKKLCATEAGLQALKKGDGTLGMRGILLGSPADFEYTGLSFVEKEQVNRKWTRITHAPDTRARRVVEENLNEPRSRYEYSHKYSSLGRGVSVTDRQVADLVTGEVLARGRILSYSGWMTRRFGAGINLYSAPCYGANPPGLDDIIQAAFK